MGEGIQNPGGNKEGWREDRSVLQTTVPVYLKSGLRLVGLLETGFKAGSLEIKLGKEGASDFRFQLCERARVPEVLCARGQHLVVVVVNSNWQVLC